MARTEQGKIAKARVDLSALMAMCETNYWRLRKLLLPAFPQLPLHRVFRFSLPHTATQKARCFLLRVTESCPYTTTLEFMEEPEAQGGRPWGLSPRLTVRIYHDAKTAEVMAFQGQRPFAGAYDYPNHRMYQKDEKFQLNSLLGDWLNHCLQYGHRIDHNSAVRVSN